MTFRMLVCIFASILISGCGRTRDYGLCIISAQKETEVNSGKFFPMHSVVKFPQALYVADYLLRNDIPLDSTVVVRKNELMQDTWSPMLVGMDESQTFSFRELLRLSLVKSDNNACDLLFKLCGMPEAVDSFINELGFNDINVAVTERQMHAGFHSEAQRLKVSKEYERISLLS